MYINELYLKSNSIISSIKKGKTQKIIEFVNFYEEKHLDTLLYISKIWNDFVTTKEELYEAFQIIILYYKDVFIPTLSAAYKKQIDNDIKQYNSKFLPFSNKKICNIIILG